MVEQIPDVKMVTSTRSTIAADHTLPTLSEMVKKNQRKKTVHQALMRMTGCLLDQGIISEQEATDYQVAWTATELVTLEQDFNRAEEAWERLNEGVKSRCRAHRDPYQIHAEIRNFWVYDCKRLILLEIKDIKSDLAEIRAAQQDAAIAALQQQLKRQPAAGGGGADAEAFYGNVQVEIGSNDDVMFRGKNETSVHLGLCCLDCTVIVDDETLVSNGAFVPDALLGHPG